MKKRNPATVPAPIGAYSHSIEVPPGARVLHVSGQVGIAADGTAPAGITAQTEMVFSNLMAILADAGMGIDDVVKFTAYLTDPADLPAYAAVRTRYLGEARPCSTLVFVSALVRPELCVEVELVAARAD